MLALILSILKFPPGDYPKRKKKGKNKKTKTNPRVTGLEE